MSHPMRRAKQALSHEVCEALLAAGTSGVLSLAGDDGYPYGVPLSYVYADGKLFFHCALQGHKTDLIGSGVPASFCVIAQDQVVPAEFTTYYRSVIAFGAVRPITDPGDKRAAIERLADRFSRGYEAQWNKEIDDSFDHLCMLEFSIHRMTGKEATELARQREKEA